MKVTYVSSLGAGGPVTHLESIAPAVAKAGASVCVICADERLASKIRSFGLEAVVVPMRHKFDVAAVRRLWPHLSGSDIVHTHDRRAGLLVRPAARATGAAVVHTYHGLPEEIAVRLGRPNAPTPPGASRLRIAWLLYGYLRIEAALAAFGTVIAPSQAMADFLTTYGVDARRVRVLPYGIDLRRTEPRPRNEVLRLAAAARLEYWKGIEVLVSACARVSHPLRLDVLGDGANRRLLERQAAELGVDAHFHGWVDNAREHVERADIFVLPSRADNLPMSVLEAMGSAVPVIASRVGGIPEMIENGVSGIILEPDDATALTEAIDRLGRDEGVRQAIARAGAARVEERFALPLIGKRTLELYEELSGPTGRP